MSSRQDDKGALGLPALCWKASAARCFSGGEYITCRTPHHSVLL